MRSDEDASSELGVWDLVGLGGITLGCVVLGLAAGWLVDEWLDTAPIFILIGLAGGVAAGVAGSWLRVRQFLRS